MSLADYNIPDKDLFGKRCLIPTGIYSEPFLYRIVDSGMRSNGWSEVPLTASSEREIVNHKNHEEDVLIVVLDTPLITERSRLIRVAKKDVKLVDF